MSISSKKSESKRNAVRRYPKWPPSRGQQCDVYIN